MSPPSTRACAICLPYLLAACVCAGAVLLAGDTLEPVNGAGFEERIHVDEPLVAVHDVLARPRSRNPLPSVPLLGVPARPLGPYIAPPGVCVVAQSLVRLDGWHERLAAAPPSARAPPRAPARA